MSDARPSGVAFVAHLGTELARAGDLLRTHAERARLVGYPVSTMYGEFLKCMREVWYVHAEGFDGPPLDGDLALGVQWLGRFLGELNPMWFEGIPCKVRWDDPATLETVDSILGLLGAVAAEPPPMANAGRPEPRLSVSGDEVTLDGKTYVLDPGPAAFVRELEDAGPGVWVAGSAMGPMVQPRPDRTYKALPAAIRDVIESRPGAGYRITLA